MPRAASSVREPLEMPATFAACLSPMSVTVPMPNWRAISTRADANAFLLSSSIVASYDAGVGTSRRHENCAGGIIPYLAALAESPLLDARILAGYAVATTFEQAEIAHLPDYRLD